MKKKDFDSIVKGVHCCMSQNECCEECPYVAAAENCGNELDADLEWMTGEAEALLGWTIRAVDWLRREEPDALITMVNHVGEIPESVSEEVFRKGTQG